CAPSARQRWAVIRFAPVLFVLSLVPVLPAAEPAPPPRPVVYYFPTQVGAKWVYQRTVAGRESEDEIHGVTAVEQQPGKVLVSVGRVEGDKVRPFRQIIVSRAGLFELDPRRPVPNSGWLLKLPVEAGAGWDLREMRLTTHGFERVIVPAGEYECIRVDETF